MIKSTHQYNRTKKHIADFNTQIDSLNAEETMHPLIKEASINSCLNMISELEAEIQEYEELVQGTITLPENIDLIDLPQYLTKIRIAKGLSQQDLATKLGKTRQEINRYEEHNYQSASYRRILEVIKALDYDGGIHLTPAEESLPQTPSQLKKQSETLFDEMQKIFCNVVKDYTSLNVLEAYASIDLATRIAKFVFSITGEDITPQTKELQKKLQHNLIPLFEKHCLHNITLGIIPIVSLSENEEERQKEKQNIQDLVKTSPNQQVRELVAC